MNDPDQELKDELKDLYLGILKVMEKRYDWLRAILSGAAAIIGAVVALRGGQLNTWTEYWLFCSSMGLLSAGLVVGCVALYGEHMRLLFIQKGILRNRLERLSPGNAPPKEAESPIWGRLEWTTVVLLLLGLLALVAFAFVSSMPSCH
jgi:hypothetical protein